jgi:alcohol dehydrogenase
MKHFSFSIPQNVYFGWGYLNDLTYISGKTGATKAFIVSVPHLLKAGYVDMCA